MLGGSFLSLCHVNALHSFGMLLLLFLVNLSLASLDAGVVEEVAEARWHSEFPAGVFFVS